MKIKALNILSADKLSDEEAEKLLTLTKKIYALGNQLKPNDISRETLPNAGISFVTNFNNVVSKVRETANNLYGFSDINSIKQYIDGISSNVENLVPLLNEVKRELPDLEKHYGTDEKIQHLILTPLNSIIPQIEAAVKEAQGILSKKPWYKFWSHRIKAQSYMSATPEIKDAANALKAQVDKVIYYIKPLFAAAKVPEDKQKEIMTVLNGISSEVNRATSKLLSTTADKWGAEIQSLGKIGNLAENLIASYDSALPDSQLKFVYRNMIVPNLEVLTENASNLVGLANQHYSSVVQQKGEDAVEKQEESKGPSESVKENLTPPEELLEKKEEPKKEEKKDVDKELADAAEALKKDEQDLPKDEEEAPLPLPEALKDIEEPEEKPAEKKEEKEAPKEEPKKTPAEEKKERNELKKELREIGTKAGQSANDAVKLINHFIDLGLKDLPNEQSFTAANKIKDVKKGLNKFQTSLKTLYKKPDDRESFAKEAQGFVEDIQKILDKLGETIPGADEYPGLVTKYAKDLVKARNLLEDTQELITHGRTFKRANKTSFVHTASEIDVSRLNDAIQNLNIVEFDDNTDANEEMSVVVVVEDQYSNAAIGIYPESQFDPNVVDALMAKVEEVNPEAKTEHQIEKVPTKDL